MSTHASDSHLLDGAPPRVRAGGPWPDVAGAAPRTARVPRSHLAGVTDFEWTLNGRDVKATLWYPALADENARPAHYGVCAGTALRDATASAPGWPLVVFSHGYLGSRVDQAFLAERLARDGIASFAIDHVDPRRELQEIGEQLVRRRADLLAALRLLRASPPGRRCHVPSLALIGHSAGAATVLSCALQARNEPGSRSDDMTGDAGLAHGIVLLAPALASRFDSGELERLRMPILIVSAEHDHEPLYGGAAEYRARLSGVRSQVLRGGGHFSFINVCDPIVAKLAPKQCSGDPRPRAELHRELDVMVLDFLHEIAGSIIHSQG